MNEWVCRDIGSFQYLHMIEKKSMLMNDKRKLKDGINECERKYEELCVQIAKYNLKYRFDQYVSQIDELIIPLNNSNYKKFSKIVKGRTMRSYLLYLQSYHDFDVKKKAIKCLNKKYGKCFFSGNKEPMYFFLDKKILNEHIPHPSFLINLSIEFGIIFTFNPILF